MKRGTIQHPKTLALARELNCEILLAVGVLESLWHWCATYAPQGDIGKYPDEMIAEGICWRKSPEKLIESLKKAGWLDANDKFRIVVHDWPDHCEEAVRKKLSRQGLTFWNGETQSRQKATPCRDGVETASRQCRDGVSPHARGPTPTPTPTPMPTPVPQTPEGGLSDGERRFVGMASVLAGKVSDSVTPATLAVTWRNMVESEAGVDPDDPGWLEHLQASAANQHGRVGSLGPWLQARALEYVKTMRPKTARPLNLGPPAGEM